MFCPKCGKALPREARFCGGCGAPIPQSAPTAAKNTKKAAGSFQKKQKFSAKRFLTAALCLMLVAAAGFGLYQLLGVKTFYLPSRGVKTSASEKETFHAEYDRRGRLISREIFTTDRTGRGNDSYYCVTYSYDGSRIVSAEVESDEDTFELEYHYDDKGHLKSIECGREEAEVECDKKGRITEITWDGGSATYTYHKNGALKEAEVDYGLYSYDFIYDDRGNILEDTTRYDGVKQTSNTCVYDENGNETEAVMTTYSGGRTALEMVIASTNDADGLPYQVSISGDRNGMSFCISFEAEDTGLVRDFRIIDVEANQEMLESIDADSTDDLLKLLEENMDDAFTLYMEFDDHGNLLESRNGALGSDNRSEFIAMRLPRSYRKSPGHNPLYFIPPIYLGKRNRYDKRTAGSGSHHPGDGNPARPCGLLLQEPYHRF